MAVNARVTLKIVVVGVKREQLGAFATADIGHALKSLAHVVAQGHVATLILAPHESHAIGLAVLAVDGDLVNHAVTICTHDTAASLEEHIARFVMVVKD